jgi:hypothetical protein
MGRGSSGPAPRTTLSLKGRGSGSPIPSNGSANIRPDHFHGKGASDLLARRSFLAGFGAAALAGAGIKRARAQGTEEVLPKHITKATIKAVRDGLDYLARIQAPDGGWHGGQDGSAYPCAMTGLAGTALLCSGNTPTRGRFAPQIAQTIEYLVTCSTPEGLLTSAARDSGQPMHGHGFSLQFLASVFGMIIRPALREKVRTVIRKAIKLTAEGQSGAGGWTYNPGQGDEGSVTVTQVQALRACQNSGFQVPKGTIEEAVRYIERCQTPEGGICYSLSSGGSARLAISAAAVATLYNAGEYDAPVAEKCLEFVWERMRPVKGWALNTGHDWYTHLYASQAFYLAGDKYWDEYFPLKRDELINQQNKSDGSWQGDFVGRSYGTSIALIILQLPYRFLPVYQR